MSVITTVCGDIKPEELGFTSCHDHIMFNQPLDMVEALVDFGMIQGFIEKPPLAREALVLTTENMYYARNYCMFFKGLYIEEEGDVEKVTHELKLFKQSGGDAIVDCSTMETRADIRKIKKISEDSCVKLVCATGTLHTSLRPAWLSAYTEEQLYERFMHEIANGVDETDIRPGFVKTGVGCYGDDGKIKDSDWLSFRAACRAAADSGYAIWIHTNNPVPYDMICELADMAIRYGCKPEKIVMCHIDQATLRIDAKQYVTDESYSRQPEYDLCERLLKKGVNIGLDTFGNEMSKWADIAQPDDFDRLRMAYHLAKLGYADQIVFGHDLIWKAQGVHTGMQGFKRLTEYAIPALRRFGLEEELVRKFVYDNPARILAH